MRRRWVLAAAAWLAAAIVTTLVGLAAVNSIGDGILGGADRPFTTADVNDRLSAAPPPAVDTTSAVPSTPSVVPSSPSAATSGVLTTAGGSVVATCTHDVAYLNSWSPTQGYHADHVVRGPATTASIRFRTDSGKGRGVRLSVTCPNGVPNGTDQDD